MNKRTLFVGIPVFSSVALAVLLAFVFARPAAFSGATFGEPYPVAPEISLGRADGGKFTLSEMQGRIVLLFFGYTSCPDVCPATLAELNLALSKLKPQDVARVQVAFITVDPDRDSPERVQEYVGRFNPEFIGLSGSQTELEKVWSSYGIYREIVDGTSAAGYIVDHTSRVILIDEEGNMRVSFGFDMPVEEIVHDLKIILKD